MSLSPRASSLARREIAFGIGQDHITHGLVVFDVSGTAADVAVERLGDGSLKFGTLHRRPRQTLQQDLALVEEASGAIAALKGEMLDKGLLQPGKLAILRMSFNG